MKKIILTSGLAILTLLQVATAQDKVKDKDKEKGKDKDKSFQEITIKREGDKDTKIIVEMKDGDILINGKPISEYKDGDLKISSRSITRNGDDQNFLWSPQGNGSSIYKLWDDNNKGGKKAFLGVTTEAADGGAKITDVVDGSAAAKAGLKEGDVITAIAGTKVADPEAVADAVQSHKAKDEVKVQYQRDGKQMEASATLGDNGSARSFSFNGGDKDGFGQNFSQSFGGNMLKDNNLFTPQADGLPKLLRTFGGRGPKLGVQIEDVDNDGGAKISKVEEGSSAEKAGLKTNDVITEVDGNKVKNVQEVREQMMDLKDKSSYNIKAKRSGSEMNFEIKVPKKVNKADI